MAHAFVLTGTLLAALAASGWAEPEYGTAAASFVIVSDSGTALTSSGAGAFAGAPDGVYFTVFGNTVGDVYTVTIAFAPGADNVELNLWTGFYTSEVSLTSVQWTGGSTPGTQALSVSLMSAALDGQFERNTILGLGWSPDFTGIVLQFTTQAGAGDDTTFTLDAVSNAVAGTPEPGTIALYALGAAGLCGLAGKRRRARRRAHAAAAAKSAAR